MLPRKSFPALYRALVGKTAVALKEKLFSFTPA
jgi:hypothetical protein